jgi:hypothetical protein
MQKIALCANICEGESARWGATGIWDIDPDRASARSRTGSSRLHRGTDMTITRIIAVVCAILACGLALGSCGSSLGPSYGLAPKWENLDVGPSTVPLKVDSIPSGAEARAGGTACRTPCTLEMPIMHEPFNVSYALDGYAPQAVAVRPVMPATSLRGLPFYLPNPAVAQLSPAAAPPKSPAPPAPPKKKRPVATATAPAAPAAPAAPTTQGPQPYPYPPPPEVFGLKRY